MRWEYSGTPLVPSASVDLPSDNNGRSYPETPSSRRLPQWDTHIECEDPVRCGYSEVQVFHPNIIPGLGFPEGA